MSLTCCPTAVLQQGYSRATAVLQQGYSNSRQSCCRTRRNNSKQNSLVFLIGEEKPHRQRKLSLHQVRKRRQMGSKGPLAPSTTKLKNRGFTHFSELHLTLIVLTAAGQCQKRTMCSAGSYAIRSTSTTNELGSVLVDAKKAHFVQRWQLCYQQHQHHHQVEPQGLLPKVSAVGSQHKQSHRHQREELAVACAVHLAVHLLPKGQEVILALVFLYPTLWATLHRGPKLSIW
eukprot:1159193-Pelagomonas_calceolata.AAC.2